MSTFGGLQQAGSALAAAQYGLNVVSQNIANANTPGYVRRSVDQASVDPVSDVARRYVFGVPNGGVRIEGTSRMNDALLDSRSRIEQGKGAAADTAASRLLSVENVFPEPSDTGLTEQLNQFWNAWGSVANDPSHAAPRNVLLSNAQGVASTLQNMTARLADLSGDIGASLTQTATDVTSLANQLAGLNNRIAVATASGNDANDLMDQRDLLLDKLSVAVGGVATLNANGSADVTVGGQSLVSGATANTVAFNGTDLTIGGSVATLTSGSAYGDLQTLNSSIPGYQAQLDAVAQQLMSTVNTGQGNAFDLNGTSGTAMFSGTGAGDIAVAFTDPNLVAASGSSTGRFDGSAAAALSSSGTSTTGPDALYVSLVGTVGSDTSLALQQSATQDTVTQGVNALRASAGGVSTDEELTNMLTYQHAYQAAGRVLSALDDMLDTLINHVGI